MLSDKSDTVDFKVIVNHVSFKKDITKKNKNIDILQT